MDGPRGSKPAHIQATPLIHPHIMKFTYFKLAEYGWFSTDEDTIEAARDTTDLLLGLYFRTSYSEVFRVLFDGTAQANFAREISTRFLSLDPAPNDPGLRSFVSSVFSFFQDFLWKQRVELKALQMKPHLLVADDSSVSPDTQDNKAIVNPEGSMVRFFEFPGEIRDAIYRAILISPEGTLVQSFTPPPLLCTSQRLRSEALPLFYKYNHFEITVKRSTADNKLAPPGVRMPSVDIRVWRRFLDMWNVFNAWGTNGLQYVERVTVIYQLSMDNGYPFGTMDEYDRRVGFRFSRASIEEGIVESPAEGIQEDSVVLNRGEFNLTCRSETQRFLFEKTRECGAWPLWGTYPLGRLTNMLWRCARDCPQAAEDVDFLCDDFLDWTGDGDGYGAYDDYPVEFFFNPDGEDDERHQQTVTSCHVGEGGAESQQYIVYVEE